MCLSCYSFLYEYPYEYKDEDNAVSWLNLYNRTREDPQFKGEEVEFSIMPDSKRSEYIAYLEHVQYVELDEEEYYDLTQRKLKKSYGLAVRAVRAMSGGMYLVRKNNNNQYLVFYDVPGSRVWEIWKAVLLIEVDELPEEIFIDYAVFK